MRIGAVTCAQNYAPKCPNFSGLWGKEETRTDNNIRYDYGMETDCGTYDEVITKTYYPFLDETDADIEKIKKENSKYSYNEDENKMVERRYSTVVDVMPRFPVTAQQYNAYVARELLSKQEMEVEDKLKGAHLQQFLNVPPKKLDTKS